MSIKDKLLNTMFKKQIDSITEKIKSEIELKSYAVSQSSNTSIEEALKRAFADDAEPDLIINYMIFACLSYTTQETGKIKLKVYKNGKEDINNNFYIKLQYLNPLYSCQGEFIEHIVLNLIYYGVAYILNLKNYFYIVKKTDLEDIVVDNDTGLPISYKYKGKSYTDKDIIIIKNINNPEDIKEPYSIFDSIERIAPLTNSGVKFLKNFFEEGGFIPGFFKSSSNVDGTAVFNQTVDRLQEEQLFKRVMNRIKSGKAAILPPNYEFVPAGTSPKDSITLEIIKHIEDIIAIAFKIPKSIIGKLSSGGSYSLTNAERKIFYDCVIDVYITKIEGAFNQYVKRFIDKNIEIKRDTSGLEYLKLYMLDYATQIAQVVGSGIFTKNEARERFFQLPVIEGGDSLSNNNNNNNQQYDKPAGDRGNPVQEGDEKKNKTIDAESDIELITKIMQEKILKILDPLIRDLVIDLKDVFNIIASSIEISDDNKDKKPSDYEDDSSLLLLLLNSALLQEGMEKFEKILKKYYQTAIKRAERIISEVYVEDRDENPAKDYEEWINEQVKKSSKYFYENDIIAIILNIIINNRNNTFENIANEIRNNLIENAQAKARIWSTTEIMKTLNEHLWNKFLLMSKKKKKTVKAWRSMRDEKVRYSHQIVDNNEWIPFEQKFTLTTINGRTYSADRPYDPELPPELVINCRCFLIVQFVNN